MNQILLENYINDELSLEERRKVVDWIEERAENQQIFNELMVCLTVQEMKFQKPLKIDSQDLFTKNKSGSGKLRVLYSTSIKVAAVLLLVVGLNSVFSNDSADSTASRKKQNQVMIETVGEIINLTANKGESKMITLPDGTTVNLNSESSLTYPKDFDGDRRVVSIEGEAFFNVAHDENKPFVVKTSDIDIKVLGTSFNVRSYPGDEKIETTLVTGKIEVLDKKDQAITFLKPSEKATFDKSKLKLVVDKVNSQDAIAWQKGILIFNHTPIKNVVEDLERRYNVKFKIESKELLNHKYTGTFDNLELEEVLEMLKVSSLINYELKNQQIMLTH